jgi:hypothetical protein
MIRVCTSARAHASGRTTGSIRADHAARIMHVRAAPQRPQQPAHVRHTPSRQALHCRAILTRRTAREAAQLARVSTLMTPPARG